MKRDKGQSIVFIDALVVIDYQEGAPFVTHNRGCDRCKSRKAVYDLHNGCFLPCGVCQAELLEEPWWHRFFKFRW